MKEKISKKISKKETVTDGRFTFEYHSTYKTEKQGLMAMRRQNKKGNLCLLKGSNISKPSAEYKLYIR